MRTSRASRCWILAYWLRLVCVSVCVCVCVNVNLASWASADMDAECCRVHVGKARFTDITDNNTVTRTYSLGVCVGVIRCLHPWVGSRAHGRELCGRPYAFGSSWSRRSSISNSSEAGASVFWQHGDAVEFMCSILYTSWSVKHARMHSDSNIRLRWGMLCTLQCV